MKSAMIVSGMCNLVGMTKVGDKGTLTKAGWAKYETDRNTVYKNRIAWTSYHNKQDLEQFATITCFGERYKWASDNLIKGSCVTIHGRLNVLPPYGDSKNPQIEIEVTELSIGPKRTASESSDTEGQEQQPAAPAPQRSAPPAARPVAKAPATASGDDGDLPF